MSDKIFREEGTEYARLHDDGGIRIKERASAPTSKAGYATLWANNNTPNELIFTDDAGTDHRLSSPVFKSYTFVARNGASGTYYSAGFYDAPTTSTTLTIGGTVNVSVGNADVPYAAHAFVVASGAGGTDLVLTVTGTSINDSGTRTPGDSQVIVADTDAATTNQYFETSKKWLGQISMTLSGSSGSFTFNYGLCKYEDFGNKDFTLTDFEAVGLANANDGGFNIELIHHKTTGWTYAASGFVPGPAAILNMNTIHNTEQDIDAGEPFAFKRAGMSTAIAGGDSEGLIVKITTTVNGSVSFMDSHIGVLIGA